MPRSQYTSGKSSSALGLTAYLTKVPETRQLVLKTGALLLADNGVCCILSFFAIIFANPTLSNPSLSDPGVHQVTPGQEVPLRVPGSLSTSSRASTRSDWTS